MRILQGSFIKTSTLVKYAYSCHFTVTRRHQTHMWNIYNNIENSLSTKTIYDLILPAVIFKASGYSFIPSTLSTILNVPLIGSLTKLALKYTAFKHFCGGSDVEDCHQLVQTMWTNDKIKSILDHSVEERSDPSSWAVNLSHKLSLLELSHSMRFVDSVPVKCTSIMSAAALEEITSVYENNPMMLDHEILDVISKESQDNFGVGINNLSKLCKSASEKNLSVLLDAEQSFRQPAVDIIARMLSKKFNRVGCVPVIYNTYQMYLRRSFTNLIRDLTLAKSNDYIFAGKIVRGAYVVSERERSSRLGCECPVFDSKDSVDDNYNKGVFHLLSQMSTENAPYTIVATHNKKSVFDAIEQMKKFNIAPNDPRVKFAQILGMCDHISIGLSLSGYNVLKLVCYGSFDDIFPWLLRRFQENQDIFGAMQNERVIYTRELKRRIFGNTRLNN